MSKTAIVIFSDPKNGSDEALGRVFNALAAAYDFKQLGKQVKIVFQGAGTRWPAELQKSSHPAYALYQGVRDTVEGVSCGCVDVFGAEPAGLDLIKDNKVPGTTGLSSFVKLKDEGYDVLIF